MAAAEDSRVSSIGVQANDYDIERVTSHLPARQRVIPQKFRDFCDPDSVKKEEVADPEYIPKPSTSTLAVLNKVKGRRRGRPPKTAKLDHAYPNAADSADTVLINDANILLSKRYACQVEGCHRIFINSRTLKKHQNTMHSHDGKGERVGRAVAGEEIEKEKAFECSVCQKRYTQRGNLDLHMRIHTQWKPHSCNVCGRSFRCMSSLRSHKMIHLGIKAYTCDVCSKAFASNNTLKEHMALHTDTRSYVCKVCSRTFRQASCFNRHLLTHSDNKRFACEVCDKRFSQLSYVRSHMKVHTGERPFECTECGKKFAHQSDKNRHMIIHSGEKPYTCSVCGAQFSDVSARRRHCRDHEGLRPHVCLHCPEAFKRVAQLRAHETRMHPQSLEDQVVQEEVVIQQVAYHMDQQVLEIQYAPEDVPNADASQPPQEEAAAVMAAHELPDAASEAVVVSEDIVPEVFLFGNGIDYVAQPDFSSQDYFCWLAVFADWAKQQEIPLDVNIFQKISQVQKSLTDVMAQPQGALSDRDNYVSLMSMSCDLSAVINGHLSCVLHSLPDVNLIEQQM